MFVYLDFYISNINLFFTSSLTKLNFYKAFFCLIGSHYGLVCSLCCISFSDSETTEDEATEPQIPLEGKEGARGFQDEAQRVPAGKYTFNILCFLYSPILGFIL